MQFYDYTKCLKNLKKEYANYHQTFSYSEVSTKYLVHCATARQMGFNLAGVFKDKESIPDTFMGLPVFIGDDTDARFLDPPDHFIALIAKGKAIKDTTGFVIGSKRRAELAAHDWEQYDREWK